MIIACAAETPPRTAVNACDLPSSSFALPLLSINLNFDRGLRIGIRPSHGRTWTVGALSIFSLALSHFPPDFPTITFCVIFRCAFGLVLSIIFTYS